MSSRLLRRHDNFNWRSSSVSDGAPRSSAWRIWADPFWVRTLLGLVTILLWMYVTTAVGTLSAFTRIRDSTAVGLVSWATVGVAGFGLLSVVLLLRTSSGKPLVPGWVPIVIGLVSLVGIFLFLAISDEGSRRSFPPGAPEGFFWPHPDSWYSVLSLPVTIAMGITIGLHRLLPSTRWFWALITLVVGLTSYPAFALVTQIAE
jgi:hypothetical protein